MTGLGENSSELRPDPNSSVSRPRAVLARAYVVTLRVEEDRWLIVETDARFAGEVATLLASLAQAGLELLRRQGDTIACRRRP